MLALEHAKGGGGRHQGRLQGAVSTKLLARRGGDRALHKLTRRPLEKFRRWGCPSPCLFCKCLLLCLSILDGRHWAGVPVASGSSR